MLQSQEEIRTSSFFEEEEEEPEKQEPKKKNGRSPSFYIGTFVIAAALAVTVHHFVFEKDTDEDGIRRTTEYGTAAENMPFEITLDGTVYSSDVTFQDLVNDGWEYSFQDNVTADELQHLKDDDVYVVTLHRGSVTAYATFCSEDDIPITVCQASALSVSAGDGEVLPCGIELGMSKADTEEILQRNNKEYSKSVWVTDYGNQECNYYEIGEDGENNITVLVCDDAVEDVRVAWSD